MAHFTQFSLIFAWHRIKVFIETAGPANFFVPCFVEREAKKNIWLDSASHYKWLLLS